MGKSKKSTVASMNEKLCAEQLEQASGGATAIEYGLIAALIAKNPKGKRKEK